MCVCVFTVPVACLNKKVIKWPNVIRAMFGITTTAWTFPVRYLVSLKCIGNARLVVTVIANFSYLFMFLARGISFSIMSNWMVLYNVRACTCAGWSEPLLCSPAVHVLDGVSLCSALRLCMCWME